jgi:hypothetical protein
MNKFRVTLAVLAVSGLALAGLAFALPRAANGPSLEREARRTAAAFFASVNARDFDRTCDLLSRRFYRAHRFRDKAFCVLALKIGFTWEPSYRFGIVGIERDGDRIVVQALASGVRGRLVLIREDGRLKVLAVQGS